MFVTQFTLIGNVIALFFAAGERLKFGRGLLRQPSCNAQRFGKILGVEPVELAHRLIHTVFPDAGRRDIEPHVELLVDGLNAVAGDRPLATEPVDVAVQGHFSFTPARRLLQTLYIRAAF